MRISAGEVGPRVGGTGRRVDINDARERLIDGELPLDVRPGRIVVDAIAGAEHGLLVPGESVSKTHARGEQVFHRVASGARDAGIAIEQYPRRSVDIDRGFGAGHVFHGRVVDGE